MPRRILAFGAGAVWRLVGPALEKIHKRISLEVYVVDLKRPNLKVDLPLKALSFKEDLPLILAALKEGFFDLIYIATPNEIHSEILLPCLGRAPAILVEKPVDIDVNRAQCVFEWVKAFGAPVLVTAHYIWYPAVQFVLKNSEIFRKIGEVKQIVFSMRESKPIEPGRELTLRHGLLFDMGVHGFTIILHLFRGREIHIEEARCARYCGAPIKEETAAQVELRIEDGHTTVQGLLLIGKAAPETDKTLILQGSKGLSIIEIKKGKIDGHPVFGPTPYEALFEAALRGKGVPYETGLKALELTVEAKNLAGELAEYEPHTWPFRESTRVR